MNAARTKGPRVVRGYRLPPRQVNQATDQSLVAGSLRDENAHAARPHGTCGHEPVHCLVWSTSPSLTLRSTWAATTSTGRTTTSDARQRASAGERPQRQDDTEASTERLSGLPSAQAVQTAPREPTTAAVPDPATDPNPDPDPGRLRRAHAASQAPTSPLPLWRHAGDPNRFPPRAVSSETAIRQRRLGWTALTVIVALAIAVTSLGQDRTQFDRFEPAPAGDGVMFGAEQDIGSQPSWPRPRRGLVDVGRS